MTTDNRARVVLATRNPGKRKELEALLSDLPLEIFALDEFQNCPEIVEDGRTFQENATKKALAIAKFTGMMAIGEDSGIEVDALGNKPGIYSARFAGPNATDEDNNRLLLHKLRNVPRAKRSARYRCVIVCAAAGKVLFTVEGECAGLIAQAPTGTNGFGYDPIFYIPMMRKTFGELPPEVKNQFSHRARAAALLKQKLVNLLRSARLMT